MAADKNVNVSFGSFLPVGIFLVFLYLKLAGIGVVATWSWWWVTSPLWIPLAVVFSIIGLVLLFYVFVFFVSFIFKGGR